MMFRGKNLDIQQSWTATHAHSNNYFCKCGKNRYIMDWVMYELALSSLNWSD